MKIRQTVLSTVILSCLLAANAAFAETAPASEPAPAAAAPADPMVAKMEHRFARAAAHMKKELDLSEEQVTQVKELMKNMHQEAEGFRQKLDEDTRAAFKKILDKPGQYEKWEDMHNQRMMHRHQKMQKKMMKEPKVDSAS